MTVSTSTTKTASLNLRLPEFPKNHLETESWQVQDIHQGLGEADASDFASEAEVNAVFAKHGA